MANTVIALKRSNVPYAIPTNLANGEIAINYADGKLFYKNTTGGIAEISGGGGLGGSYFGTVNAAGTFLVADTSNDILSIKEGDNITIIGDAVNDSLSISANLKPAFDKANTVASDLANTAIAANNYAGQMANAANAYAASLTPDLSPAYNQANAAYLHANAAFDRANLSNDVLLVDTVWTHANSAYDKANNALPNTTGVVFNGNLSISSDLTIGNNLYSINSAFFDTSTTVASVAKGQIVWNGGEETFDLGLANGAVLQVGQEIYYRVKNQTGSTITEGTVVMAAGTLGASGRILVTPAVSDGTYPSKYLMGIATTTMATGEDGYVTAFGKVRGLDTSMWSEGDILYANVSVAGALQNTAPAAPNTKTTVAIVVSKHASTGTLFVRPTYGSKLNEDEMVELHSLTNDDVLQYVSANGRFENKPSLAAVNAWSNTVGISSNNYAGVMANAANAYAVTVGNAANATSNGQFSSVNSYISLITGNVNSYVDLVTANANNYSGTMANAVNAYTVATYATITNAAAAFSKANSANVLAKAAYDFANTLGTAAANIGNVAPSTPAQGSLWWNNDAGRLLIYYTDNSSSQWVDASPVPDAYKAKVTASTTAPSGPADGELWWNSIYGRLFVYYVDGDSSQWVDANPATDYRPIWNETNAAFQVANAAFNNANSTHSFAISAYTASNSGYDTSNAAFGNANSTHTFAIAGFTKTNAAFTVANAAFGNANSTHTFAIAAHNKANAAFSNANSTHTFAIAAFTNANSALTYSISAYDSVNASYIVANVASNVANAALSNSNISYTIAVAALTKVNSAFVATNAVFGVANAGFNNANATHLHAVYAFSTANGAYDTANAAATTGKAIAMAIVFGG